MCLPTERDNQIYPRLHRHLDYLHRTRFYTQLLVYLKNKVFIDTYYINRLKLASVPTPAGTVNTQQQLNKAIQCVNTANMIPSADSNIKYIQE